MRLLIVAVVATILHQAGAAEEQALFIHDAVLDNEGHRVPRQTTNSANADQMVQNILQWLQGVYTQNSRRIRQGTLREYLPPSNTQKPRPFEAISPATQQPQQGIDIHQGYPAAGSITPQPPFNIYTNPTTGGITGEGYPTAPHNEITPPDYNKGYQSPQQPQPPFNEGTTGYPTRGPTTGYPSAPPRGGFPTSPPPDYTTGYPSERPTFATQPPTGYPTQRPTYPTQRPTYPSQRPTYPTQRPTYPTQQPSTGYPTGRPTFATQPPTGYPTTGRPTYGPTTGFPTQPPITSVPSTYGPSTGAPITSAPNTTPGPTDYITSPSATEAPAIEDNNLLPNRNKPDDNQPGANEIKGTEIPTSDEDLRHPPHIHAINVECAKDMMTINIEFNREFNGVIYSKGFYTTPECRYVNENSEQSQYKFTVSLNSCGTEFINAFDTQGQSYLENVLVLQNEPGIQEVWDTIRSVRCLWEGNLKESLSVSLSVGMLSQEIVTFSGDTAMAKLDIQMGKGPFAPSANGLVKIGETMTLVVSVSGDPGFDIQVKDCRATDADNKNVVPLTDENGCVLKPKLFGAFQKTRNTGNTGASIIAYAFFSAFKFPDIMDLMIECNIELCKTDCQVCPDPNQKLEPGRRRKRDLEYYVNQTMGDAVTMGRHLRVILPEDLSTGNAIIHVDQDEGICMSTPNFVLSSLILISLLTASSLFSSYLWLKNQQQRHSKL